MELLRAPIEWLTETLFGRKRIASPTPAVLPPLKRARTAPSSAAPSNALSFEHPAAALPGDYETARRGPCTY